MNVRRNIPTPFSMVVVAAGVTVAVSLLYVLLVALTDARSASAKSPSAAQEQYGATASASASPSASGSASPANAEGSSASASSTADQAVEAFGAGFVAQSLGKACGPAAFICGQLGGPFSARLLYEESQRYKAPGGPADQQRAAAERRAARDDSPASAGGTVSPYAARNQGSPHSCNEFSGNPANRCP